MSISAYKCFAANQIFASHKLHTATFVDVSKYSTFWPDPDSKKPPDIRPTVTIYLVHLPL